MNGARLRLAVVWAVVGVGVVHPPHGTRWPICWMNASSGLPCPGCGLMRSVSCTARGMWYDAWTYHPFGPLLFAACVLVAGWSLLPMRHRERIASWLERRRSLPTRLYTALVAAFLTFGMIRALLTFSE